MKISGNSSNEGINPKIENRGDVSRECLETSEVINTLVVPRLIKPNEKNGIKLIHATGKKGGKGVFKGVKAKVLPSAGDAHLAALKVFRNATHKNGYTGEKKPHRK